jgi:hypothetical protein
VHRKGDQRGPQLTSATIEIFFKSALRLIDGQMSQMIYICYGITKSANTFLYQLTEEVFRAAGRKPARLGPPLRPRMSVENYFGSIDPTLLQDISVQAAGRDIVLKTHALPHPGVGRLIAAGSVLASFRSPRDRPLHTRSRPSFAPTGLCPFFKFSQSRRYTRCFGRPDRDLPRLVVSRSRQHIQINEICFDSASVVARIGAQIGVAIDPADVLKPFHGNRCIGQSSKGAALRFREMAPEQQSVFLERYATLYRQYTFETAAAAEVADRGCVKTH